MLKISVASLMLFLGMLSSSTLHAVHPKNFQEAKKQARIIWSENPKTFYCNCKYDEHSNIDHQSCGYEPGDNKRAHKVEWEHLVPASWFGKQKECWREPICKKKNGHSFKGRKCCEKIDAEFRKMYTDLHNIVPAIGEVNQSRNDYRFGELNPPNREPFCLWRGCQIWINNENRTVEPSDEVKGFIARVHLYMAKTYQFKLSKGQEKMFKRWDKTYPPTEWEVRRNAKIKEIQGNDNTFITSKSKRQRG